MSSYIINEFERRNDKYDKYRKERSKMDKDDKNKKCSEFMSKFDERVKTILEGDKSLDSFTVGFPSECNREVNKYLKDNSFDLFDDNNKDEYKDDNRILFRYNAGKNSISAMLFKSCIDPVNL